jgi:hypothetical protein
MMARKSSTYAMGAPWEVSVRFGLSLIGDDGVVDDACQFPHRDGAGMREALFLGKHDQLDAVRTESFRGSHKLTAGGADVPSP